MRDRAEFYQKAFILAATAILTVFISILLALFILESSYHDRIYPNVRLSGQDVGGLTPDAAAAVVEKACTPESQIILSGEDAEFLIPCNEIGLAYDYAESARRASMVGREGGLYEQITALLDHLSQPADPDLAFSLDEDKLKQKVAEATRAFNRLPRDATILLENGEVKQRAEAPGYEMDGQETLAQIKRALGRGKMTVQTAGKILSPNVVGSKLQGINALLGECTTRYLTEEKNRIDNIELACSTINNTLVEPGEVFSLNERLGPRTEERGYANAPVLVHDQLVPELGGGICQVATTLYNAARKAGLKIVERSPHSLPVPYVPAGFDATISEDIDFKFANDLDKAVFLTAGAGSGLVAIRVFGEKDPSAEPGETNPSFNPPLLTKPEVPQAIRSVPKAGKMLALTFDDGPSKELTPSYLKVLQEESVPATFFLIGKHIERAPGFAAQIAAAGHEIGNHTYGHPNLTTLSPKAVTTELTRTSQLIEAETGIKATCFRPPGGNNSFTVTNIVEDMDMVTILWSIDPQDWRPEATAEKITDHILSRLHHGAIILLHENRPETLAALPGLIKEIKDRGYTFVTVSQLL